MATDGRRVLAVQLLQGRGVMGIRGIRDADGSALGGGRSERC